MSEVDKLIRQVRTELLIATHLRLGLASCLAIGFFFGCLAMVSD